MADRHTFRLIQIEKVKTLYLVGDEMVGVVVLLGGTDLPLGFEVDFFHVVHQLAVGEQYGT